MNRRQVLEGIAAGAAAVAVPQTVRAANVPLKIAAIPIDVAGQAFYGVGNGMFQKAGFDVSVERIANGGAIVSAVLGGAVQIGFSNVVSLAVAHGRGLPLTVVAPAGLYSSKEPTSVLMVAKDSPIHTGRDCNGKTIGINGLKNITEYSTDAWIAQNGGDPSTVKYIEMTFAEMAPALAAGRIDVGFVAEPVIEEAKKTVRVLCNVYDAIAPSFMIAAYFTTTAWANANADAVRRFAETMREVAVWANGHRKETAQMLADAARLPVGVTTNMARAEYPTRLNPADLQPPIDVTVKYGDLKPFPARDLIWPGLRA